MVSAMSSLDGRNHGADRDEPNRLGRSGAAPRRNTRRTAVHAQAAETTGSHGSRCAKPRHESPIDTTASHAGGYTIFATLVHHIPLTYYSYCVFHLSISFRNHIVTGFDLYRDATCRVMHRHLPLVSKLPQNTRKGSVGPVWVGGFYRLRVRFQSLRRGRSQMSFLGLSYSLSRSYRPRPLVAPTWIQPEAL